MVQTTKQQLLEKCSKLGLKVNKSTSVAALQAKLKEHDSLTNSIIPIGIPTAEPVQFVYHLADIHIRYLERHGEYKEVFSRLVDYIKNDKNIHKSIMVICGDIFHNKDRFISETIIVFDNLLKELSNYMDVFIILGNHDCFNHRDRLDTLTGIMQISKYSRVHLMKNSGLYAYSNIVFGLSSITDGMIVKCPQKLQGKCYIGLYHGIITGCHLDNDYKSTGLSIENFENYDIVMLGDIHKRQFLNKEKTVAYPGSLIQQSFKEEVSHGFLLWNLETKQSDFVCIQNDYAFLDLNLNEDIQLVDFPANSRIRVLMEPEDLESDLKVFTEKIATRTKILSIKTIFKDRILNDTATTDETTDTLESKEKNIIKSFIPKEDLDDIMKIHDNLMGVIEQSDMNYKNSLPWSIKEVEFMNIFCYGGDYLNKLTLNSGITGILAANASGKTNILNTILYGLFGNIYTRNQNQNNRNIISRFSKKKELYVKLTIEMLNGELFYIERRAKNRTRNEQILLTETVNFSNDTQILNLTTKPETERSIRETLGFSTKEDFILTNMISNISYGANISIITMNGSQLDEIFNNMFNLNKYRLLNSEAKSACKALIVDKNGLEAQIKLLERLDIDIVKERKKLLDTQCELKTLKQTKEQFSKELENTYEKISKLNNSHTHGEETKEYLLAKIKEYDTLHEVNIEKEKFYETECERLSKILKNPELYKYVKVAAPRDAQPDGDLPSIIAKIEKDIAFYEGKKQNISFSSDITEEYINAKKIINSYQNKKEDSLDLTLVKETIKNMKYDKSNSCYTLGVEERQSMLDNLNKTYINNEDFLKYKKIIEDKEKRDLVIEENITIQQNISKLKAELKNNMIRYAHSLRDKIKEYTECLDSIDDYYEVQELKEKLKIIENNEEYNVLLNEKLSLIKKVSELDELINTKNSQLSNVEANITKYNSNSVILEELNTKIKTHERNINLYKSYIDLTHSKNLPKQLISNVIKNICINANHLIFNMCGLLCHITENDKWEIVIKKGNIVVGPEHCSGYERFVINVALKIAFDRFKQLPSIKLFLIDEVIDCVSEDNFDQIDILLSNLKQHYSNVFLISHNEELKKKVENKIDIEVNDNCSRIFY